MIIWFELEADEIKKPVSLARLLYKNGLPLRHCSLVLDTLATGGPVSVPLSESDMVAYFIEDAKELGVTARRI